MLSYIKNSRPWKKAGPPIAAEATAKPEPVLNADDESFLQSQLDASDEPAFIFPGSEATSGTVTPAVAEAAAEAEKETAKEKEWKDVLATRWEGLKRTVSSAADKRKAKAAEDAAQKEEKKKLKEKGKEKAARPEEREDELTAALEQLNLAAEDVTHLFPKLLRFC
jgi:hypothetical protein